ncbi:MAG: MarR family transcriptional regulator [Actinobacteria bacterium]|nr:MarR family transcriptional regulator [Actinomycetota bacterium]
MRRTSKAELIGELFTAVRANQLATDKMDDAAARGMGVNRTDSRALDIIERLGPVTAGRLAADAGLTSGAVTAVIDRLAAKGYVRRVADPDDRRRVLIEKTTKLEAVSERFYGPLAERSLPLIDRFTIAELEAIVRFLEMGTELVESRVAELREERVDHS